ncbi:transcription elongation factor GreA, partial [Turicibacter sanguinis]|nr:transcription elongation factor GreA [Turicibacter sanguinis]
MKEKQQHLTLEGIKKFQDELDHLQQVRMEEIKVKLQEARAQGDLSENAEYDAAREEQAMVYERIQELQYILKNAVVIESDENSEVITIGSTVSYQEEETDEQMT